MFFAACSAPLRRRILLLCAGLLAIGCQTMPGSALSDEQIMALREMGFQRENSGWELSLDGPLLFKTDTSDLSDHNRKIVAHVVKILKDIGIERLHVEGHTDSTGGKGYNEALSRQRAEAVAREIDRNGLPYSNIKISGYGTDNPVSDNTTKKGRAQNRRVAIIVPVE